VSRTAPLTIRETHTARGGVERYELRAWAERYRVAAGVTAGVDGLDFGLGVARSATATLEQWIRLMAAVGPGIESAAVARQVHGRRIRRHPPDSAAGLLIQDDADGHVAAAPGILVAVTVADCVPVYLLERARGAVAVLHAGWRGIAAGILEAGVEALLAASGGSVTDVVMHCGVSICGACYEVGPEVPEALGLSRPPGKVRLDLRAILTERARALGGSKN